MKLIKKEITMMIKKCIVKRRMRIGLYYYYIDLEKFKRFLIIKFLNQNKYVLDFEKNVVIKLIMSCANKAKENEKENNKYDKYVCIDINKLKYKLNKLFV